MKQSETNKKYTRFVPKLALDAISKSEYKRKEDLYCILHTINNKQTNFRNKFNQYHAYLEIPQIAFKKVISGSDNFNSAMKFLKEMNIIDCNESYSNIINDKSRPVFAKKYRINQEYLSKPLEIEIQDKNINKKIMEMEKETREFNDRRLMFSKTNYYKNFKIDYPAAYEFLIKQTINNLKVLALNNKITLNDEELRAIVEGANDSGKNKIKFIGVKKQFNHILSVFSSSNNKILSIKKDYLYFNRNTTNNRLDTNLTTLPTELRQFIIGKEILYNVDIKNSQPFFLYCILKTEGKNEVDKEELERYGNLVSDGKIYEYLFDEYEKYFNVIKNKYEGRKFIKGLMFKILFSKVTSYQKIKEFFYSLFPTIMDFINETNRPSNKILANKLTTAESTAIISIILPELGKLGIKPFTIHDSFVCNESEVETIIRVFNERITEMYGIVPQLHVKTLIDDCNGQSDVEEEDFFSDNIKANEMYTIILNNEEIKVTGDYINNLSFEDSINYILV